jgi:hypothetical protein
VPIAAHAARRVRRQFRRRSRLHIPLTPRTATALDTAEGSPRPGHDRRPAHAPSMSPRSLAALAFSE